MRVVLFSWFLFALLPQLAAQAPTRRHLYLEWRHSGQMVLLGHISGTHYRRVQEQEIALTALTPGNIADWLGPADSSAALLYFHCMWGQEKHFHRQCLRSLDNALHVQPDTGIRTVISVIWQAGGVRYKQNWNSAAGKGKTLAPVLGWISDHYADRLHGLAHSMGNRFLEGALQSTGPALPVSFQSLVLFSPDLDATGTDTDLENLARSTERLTLFLHRRDRVLFLSRWMLGRQRLGRSGPVGTVSKAVSGKLGVIDMTGKVRGVQNHTHLRKKWARQQLSLLWSQ